MRYRVLVNNKFGEGWKRGDIIAMDDEAAKVPLERKYLEIYNKEDVFEDDDNSLVGINQTAVIGVYLQRFETGEKYCASDRIRGEWLIRASKEINLYNPFRAYDTVIFHIPTDKISQIKADIKILDICDKVWEGFSNFNDLIREINVIVVPTEHLKSDLSKITDKEIVVIKDRHLFSHYDSKINNRHNLEARKVVWFGYSDNANIEKYLPILRKYNLKLKVISDKPLGYEDEFKEWKVSNYIREISKCDFALLPFNKQYKSNNKEITALLSGIPVAKNEEDIERLIDPDNRQKQLESFKDIKDYDVKYSVKEYLDLIDHLRSRRKKEEIVLYTAISGGYDLERDDIKCFTDYSKFKLDVLNAKIYKVLSHKYFDCNYSIWIDGNILPLVDKKEIVKLLGDNDLAVFRHPIRKCIYDEYEHAKRRLTNDLYGDIDTQMLDYRKEGLPENFGLGECALLIRRHNKIIEEFNNRWWAEITRYSYRDQMSFPYVLWKMKDRIKVKFLDGNIRNHKYFKYNVRSIGS